jgi:chromosome segregation ATPase
MNDHLLQYQDALREQIAISARLTNENNEIRRRIDECNDALSSVHRLNEELQTKDLLIARLQSDIDSKTQQIADQHESFQTTNSTRVEKQLVKSILLSYFHTPIDKQQEVVPILSALVGFTHDEYDKAMHAIANNYNNSTGSSWLSGWLGGNPVRAKVPSDMPEYHPDKVRERLKLSRACFHRFLLLVVR